MAYESVQWVTCDKNKNKQNNNYIYIYIVEWYHNVTSQHSENFQTYTLTTLEGVDYIKYVQCRLLKLLFKIGQYQRVNIDAQFYFDYHKTKITYISLICL